jgi:hypothetical protein
MNTVITGTAGKILIDLAAVLLNIWQVTNTTLGPELVISKVTETVSVSMNVSDYCLV